MKQRVYSWSITTDLESGKKIDSEIKDVMYKHGIKKIQTHDRSLREADQK